VGCGVRERPAGDRLGARPVRCGRAFPGSIAIAWLCIKAGKPFPQAARPRLGTTLIAVRLSRGEGVNEKVICACTGD
jgi:hypothetical protein